MTPPENKPMDAVPINLENQARRFTTITVFAQHEATHLIYAQKIT